MCYWTALHAGHVWFFFSFSCAWRCPFCRMTPAWHSYFIYGLLTFLGLQQKSDRTSHPFVICTSAFQLCWSAPPSAVIRLQAMRCALPMEVDPRGSWCEGQRKVFTVKEITSLFPGSLVCCLKPILLFNDIPLCICQHLNIFTAFNLSIKFYNLSCKRYRAAFRVINKNIAAQRYFHIGFGETGSDPVDIEHYCAVHKQRFCSMSLKLKYESSIAHTSPHRISETKSIVRADHSHSQRHSELHCFWELCFFNELMCFWIELH